MLWLWISAIILILLLLLLSLAFHFSQLILRIKTHSHEQIVESEIKSGRMQPSEWESLMKETVQIRSPFGYTLHGYFIPNGQAKKAVILVHGVTNSHVGTIKYSKLFLKRGFHVLMYDQRRHGNSGGSNTTYGWYEKFDLQACVDWAVDRCGKDCIIGIFGESMGAAVALQYAAIDHRASFYIVDCPYSSIGEQLLYRLKCDYHLPAFPLYYLAVLICRLRAGFWIQHVSPIKDMTSFETPALFIHGQEDSYIPKDMSIRMVDMKPGKKKLYLAPNAGHAQSLWKNPEEYDRIVGEFFDEID